MSIKETFIERLRFEVEIKDLEYNRKNAIYLKLNAEYEMLPTPEKKEERMIALRNAIVAGERTNDAWKKLHRACDHISEIEQVKRPLKVVHKKDIQMRLPGEPLSELNELRKALRPDLQWMSRST